MKVTLQLATSLDGFIARGDGSFDWCFTDQDYGMGSFVKSVDAIIMGRVCYELVLAMGEKPDPEKRYYVLTHHSAYPGLPHVTFFAGHVVDLYQRMQAEGVQHAWLFGGGQVCGQFAQAGLIDECIVALHPLALGRGIPLFGGLRHDLKLKLKEAKPYDSGLAMLHYEVVKKPAATAA